MVSNSNNNNNNTNNSNKTCENPKCNTIKTPLWRKGWANENGRRVRLCNACGLHYRKGHFCKYCHQMYKDGEQQQDSNNSAWLSCMKCNAMVHKDCALKHEEESAQLSIQDSSVPYFCVSCLPHKEAFLLENEGSAQTTTDANNKKSKKKAVSTTNTSKNKKKEMTTSRKAATKLAKSDVNKKKSGAEKRGEYSSSDDQTSTGHYYPNYSFSGAGSVDRNRMMDSYGIGDDDDEESDNTPPTSPMPYSRTAWTVAGATASPTMHQHHYHARRHQQSQTHHNSSPFTPTTLGKRTYSFDDHSCFSSPGYHPSSVPSSGSPPPPQHIKQFQNQHLNVPTLIIGHKSHNSRLIEEEMPYSPSSPFKRMKLSDNYEGIGTPNTPPTPSLPHSPFSPLQVHPQYATQRSTSCRQQESDAPFGFIAQHRRIQSMDSQSSFDELSSQKAEHPAKERMSSPDINNHKDYDQTLPPISQIMGGRLRRESFFMTPHK